MNEKTEDRASLYVLGLLEQGEATEFERQLKMDSELRALVDELDRTAAQLAHVAPAQPLPSDLRKRVLAQAPKRNGVRFSPARSWVPWILAAGLALAASYLVAERNHLRHRVARLEARDLFAEIQIVSLESRMANAPNARAVVVWNEKRQRGLLQLSELPPNDVGHDYELWLFDARYLQPVNGGAFHLRSDETRPIAFQPARPVRAAKGFSITLEGKGGVAKAEGPVVLE